MCRSPLFVLLLSALALAVSAPNAGALAVYDSLTYAHVGGRPLHLAIFLPNVASPTHRVPCVVWIHGGGWEAGSYLPVPGFAIALAEEKGIAVASVEYRLTTEAGHFGSQPVIFPAQINDVKGAVRWLRAHASTFYLNTNRFGAWGNSAGGHLAALLGTSGGVASLEGTVGGNPGESSGIQVFADYYGPTDILNMESLVTMPPGCLIDYNAPDSPTSHLVGWDGAGEGIGDILLHELVPWGPYPHLVSLTESANPITWLDPDDPPCLIEHGDEDTTVPPGASRVFNDALNRTGVQHYYRVVPGVSHGDPGSEVEQATVEFLAATLLGESTSADGTGSGAGPTGARAGAASGALAVTPNPCAGSCQFSVSRSAGGDLVEVADVAGRRVRNLVVGPGGTVRWDGRDDAGEPVPSGLYFAKLAEQGRTDAHAVRLVILR